MTLLGFIPDRSGEGERRRDASARLAAANRSTETLTLRVRTLELARTGAEFTIDDLSTPDELRGAFPARGPYRGAAMLGLARQNPIGQTGERRKSARAHRHGKTNPVWKATAAPAVINDEIRKLEAALKAAPPARRYVPDYCI